jgi:hypothetical protein
LYYGLLLLTKEYIFLLTVNKLRRDISVTKTGTFIVIVTGLIFRAFGRIIVSWLLWDLKLILNPWRKFDFVGLFIKLWKFWIALFIFSRNQVFSQNLGLRVVILRILFILQVLIIVKGNISFVRLESFAITSRIEICA